MKMAKAQITILCTVSCAAAQRMSLTGGALPVCVQSVHCTVCHQRQSTFCATVYGSDTTAASAFFFFKEPPPLQPLGLPSRAE